jgi:hypothetical protein
MSKMDFRPWGSPLFITDRPARLLRLQGGLKKILRDRPIPHGNPACFNFTISSTCVHALLILL